MYKWTILISVLIVGISIAVGVWFFVRVSTDDNMIDTTSSAERGGFFSFFGDTFGLGDDENLPGTTTPSDTTVTGPTFRERLRRAQMLPIANFMIAGAAFTTAWEVSSTTGATTTEESVRFVERETGHIYDLSLESGITNRVTNTTIPAIQEAFFGPNGSSVALRYLSDDNETIETYVAPLATTTVSAPFDLDGAFFPQNIPSLSISPTGREVFYITRTDDRAFGQISSLYNGSRSTIFESSLREWTSSWKTPETLFVTTKPSSVAVGVSYALGRNGELEQTISTGGLTILPSPSGQRIMYASASPTSFNSFIFDWMTQETYPFSIKTLPEKCVWKGEDILVCAVPNSIPQNTPDAWYQGHFSFNDTLWKINLINKQYDFLYVPETTDARQTMDMIDLAISDDGTILSFINKKDLRGWVADITPVEGEEEFE